MVMADQRVIFLDSANDIAVHDLNMVDIEEQFKEWGVHSLYQFKASFDIVTKIARVSFHGVGAVSRIEMLQDECNLVPFSVSDYLLPAIDAVLFGRSVCHVRDSHPGKSDYAWRSGFDCNIDSFGQLLDAFRVVRIVDGALCETVTADQGNFKSFFKSQGIKFGVDSLDRFDPNFDTIFDQVGDRHGIETPTHNRLANAFVSDLEVNRDGIFGRL